MFLFASVAFAQSIQTGAITAVVTDQSGALVTGATVDIINESIGKTDVR